MLQAPRGVLGRFGLRGGRAGAFSGRLDGVLGALRGRCGGALKASVAACPCPRSVKHHVFYERFLPSQSGTPVLTQVAAQAPFVHNAGSLGSTS